jgi:hypothetical protein
VVPRDRYNNTLAIKELGLSVNMSVTMDGPDVSKVYGQPFASEYYCKHVHTSYEGMPSTTRANWTTHTSTDYGKYPEYPLIATSEHSDCLNVSWDSKGTDHRGGWMDPSWDLRSHNSSHFDTRFYLTISGVYIFEVALRDIRHRFSETLVESPEPLSGSPFNIKVVAAELDTNNTRILRVFDTHVPEGQVNVMELLARDRFGNNRGAESANDTLTLTVKDKNQIFCDGNNGSWPRTGSTHWPPEPYSEEEPNQYGNGHGYSYCSPITNVLNGITRESTEFTIYWNWHPHCPLSQTETPFAANGCYRVSFMSIRSSQLVNMKPDPYVVGVKLGHTKHNTLPVKGTYAKGSLQNTPAVPMQTPFDITVHSRVNGTTTNEISYYDKDLYYCNEQMFAMFWTDTEKATETCPLLAAQQPYLTMPRLQNTLFLRVMDEDHNLKSLPQDAVINITFSLVNAGDSETALAAIECLEPGCMTRVPQLNCKSCDVYQFDFTFNSPEEFEYNATIHVAGRTLSPVRWAYQLLHSTVDWSSKTTCCMPLFYPDTDDSFAPEHRYGTYTRSTARKYHGLVHPSPTSSRPAEI